MIGITRTARASLFLMLACTILLSSCGTAGSICRGQFAFYSGLNHDVHEISLGPECTGVPFVMALLDLPLSFIADSILLPFAFLFWIVR